MLNGINANFTGNITTPLLTISSLITTSITTNSITIGTNNNTSSQIGLGPTDTILIGGDMFYSRPFKTVGQNKGTLNSNIMNVGYSMYLGFPNFTLYANSTFPGITLAANTGTYCCAIFGPSTFANTILVPTAFTSISVPGNFGTYIIIVNLTYKPGANTCGRMSFTNIPNTYNNGLAVSMNHYATDTNYCSYQCTQVAQIYTTTTYLYLYIENLYTDTMGGFTNAAFSITRIA